ncbi:probable protein N-lysine methyltransferase METTL21A [Coccomyxa sp. Obi]|nr:probable protein N-lysine methyltransferase METTL21A [Coccomyxa sp. Obi]
MLSSKDVTFGNVTLQCLCRRPGEYPQKCWTLQNESSTQGIAFPEQTVDDIGLDIWPASEVLCRFLADHPALATRATTILELGAGVGLPCLLAALLGEAPFMLTDYDPQVLEVLQRNIDSNGLSDRGRVHQMNWKTWRGEPDLGQFELVLGADLLYASASVKDFMEVLRLVLAPEGVFLMAHQIRRSILLDPKTRLPRLEEFDAPLEQFKRMVTDAGLHMRELLVIIPEDPGSTTDSEFRVMAVGWTETTLNNMPV